MAFNINAQIILSQPKNLNNITNQITKQLGKATKLNINIGNAKQLTTLSKQLTTLNNSFTKLNSNIVAVGKSQNVVNSQISKTNQSLKTQSGLVGSLGKRFGSVAKQAVAFGLISRPIYDLQRALTQAVQSAVKFEREIVRISQVTGRSTSQLSGLTNQISSLSRELGINANELAETSRVIAQAGIRGKDLERVLTALARSTLAPTFGKITDTTEGLIAAFGQFGLKGKDAEAVLGSLNKVSKEFAVEAEDLISVVRRTGGVFAQAAGDTKGTIGALQELTAIFTAVRSTTRESADTIAAGLRTIFSRIQRGRTIEFLKQFNVDLTDAKGNFVGIFPAFDQLSQKLSTLIKQGDALTLSAIAEELGGIRQIGKLLPAIAQFDKARKALQEAQKGAIEGLGVDVAKGLDTVDNRVKRVRESFNQLIRTVFESDAFQNFTKNILASANSFLEFANTITSALEPILPILTSIGAFKLGRGLSGILSGGIGNAVGGAVTSVTGSTATAQAAQKTAAATINQNNLINTTNSTLTQMSRQLANLIQVNNSGFDRLNAQAARGRSTVVTGFAGARRRASGGKILGFNNGGIVPGQGNTDTVPATLTPGEFVIRKDSVKEIGVDRLQRLNSGGRVKFALGGQAREFGGVGLLPFDKSPSSISGAVPLSSIRGNLRRTRGGLNLTNKKNRPALNASLRQFLGIGPTSKGVKTKVRGETIQDDDVSRQIDVLVKRRIGSLVNAAAEKLGGTLNAKPVRKAGPDVIKSIGTASTTGTIFEGALNLLGAPLGSGREQQAFDFPLGLGSPLIDDFPAFVGIPTDAKRTLNRKILKDIATRKTAQYYSDEFVKSPQFASLAFAPSTESKALSNDQRKQLENRRLTTSDIQRVIGKNVKAADFSKFGIISAGFRGKYTLPTGKNKGGGISGQDTVPALLTPGEFVFNKESASRIGYGNLNRMNKKGIQGFNKGGVVGVQRFNVGGLVDPRGANVNALLEDIKRDNERKDPKPNETKGGTRSGRGRDLFGAAFALQTLAATVTDADSSMGQFANGLTNVLFTLTAFQGLLPSTDTLKGIAGKAGLGLKGGGLLPSAGAASGLGAGGIATAAALPLVAGLAGGGIGRFLGGTIADRQLGQQESVGTIKGDTSVSAAQQRKGLGFGGAVAGGAAAGAAIGSFIPVIGTLLGGVIGAGAGAIIGALTTPLDAAAQQAAFETAKSLQEGGKTIGDALKNLQKEFNVRTFSKFADEFTKQSDNISRKLPEIAANLDANTLFSGRNAAIKEAAKNLSEFLKPEDLKAAREQLNSGLGKVFDSLDQFDLNRIIDTGGPKDLNEAFKQAAVDGNKLAEAFIKLERETTAQELAAKGAAILQDEEGDQVLGRSLLALSGTFDFVTGSAADLNTQIDTLIKKERLSAESGDVLREQITEEFNTRKAAAEEQKRSAAAQANFNNALKESQESLNSFASNLKVITSNLTLSLSQTSQNLDTLAKRIQNIASGSGSTVLNRQQDPNAVLRQIESFSGQDLGDVRKLRESQEKLPDILSRAVQNAGGAGAAQPAVVDSVIKQFAQETGLSLSGTAAEAIRNSLTALITKRQTGGTGTPIQAGAALLEAANTEEVEDLFKIFGIGAEAIKSASDELIQAYEKQVAIFEQRTSIELDRLRRAQKFEQDILSRRINNEQIISSILGKSSSGIDESVSTLKRQISGLSGTTDVNAILEQKREASVRKSQIEALAESGQLTEENSRLLAALGGQIERADAALKIFANDTSVAASLQQAANQARARGDAATGALDDLIGTAISGDTEGAKAILSQQQSLDRVIGGTGNLQDAIKIFQSQNSPIVRAIAEQRLGEGGFDSLINNLRGQLAGQLRGGPLGGLADQLLTVVKSENQQLIDLAADANILANQQLTALNNMQTQNESLIAQQTANLSGAGGPSDQQVFSDAVASFQNAVNGLDVIINRGGAPLGRAAGGVIHRNQGGVSDGALVGAFTSRFSQGTDTIPAMLSPGEYVVRASAVRNVGVGTLDAINNGSASAAKMSMASRGGVIYREAGGLTSLLEGKKLDELTTEKLREIAKKQGIAITEYKTAPARSSGGSFRDSAGPAAGTLRPETKSDAQLRKLLKDILDKETTAKEQERLQKKRTEDRETATRLADSNVKRLLPVAKRFPIAYRAKLKEGDKFFNEYLQLRSTLKGNFVTAKGNSLDDLTKENYDNQSFAEVFPSNPKKLFEKFFQNPSTSMFAQGQRHQGYRFTKDPVPFLYDILKESTVDRSTFPNNANALRNNLIEFFFAKEQKKSLQPFQPYAKLLNSPLVTRSSKYLEDIFITRDLKTLEEFDKQYRVLRNAQGKFKKPEEKLEGGIFDAARGEGVEPKDEDKPDPDALKDQLEFEKKREEFFKTPNRRLKQLDTSIKSSRKRLAEMREKSQNNPRNAKLKEIVNRLQFRINRLNFFRNKISKQLEKRAGFDLENDPLLQVLTPEEDQFRERYNNLVGSGLATNNNNDFDKAEKLLQDFLAQGSPNGRVIARRIQFEKFRLFGNPNASRPERFHSGGFVGGFAKGGEVPIIAQEGEYVMSRGAVDSIGRGTMDAINKYHSGGLVQYRQTGGAASTGPIVTSTDVGQLQQVQSFNALAQIGEKEIGATNNVSTNVVDLTNKNSQKLDTLDTLNNNLKGVIGALAVGFTTLSNKLSSVDSSIGDLGSDLPEDFASIFKSDIAVTALRTDSTAFEVNQIRGVNTKIKNIIKRGLFGGGKVGFKGVTITNMAQLQAAMNTFGAVTNQLGGHMNTYGAVTNQLGTHMSTFGAAVNQFSASINNIPEFIEIRLAPVDIAGINGFTQQVVDGVINKLIDMSVIGQPLAQNSSPPQPGRDLT